MIKITYLITVFNEVKTVKKAIEDIINIKYDNKEIIIIDNASTDGSQEIIKNFHNIKQIIREKNLGYGSTITEGLRIAKGKYIYIHNSDLEYDHLKSLDMMNYAEKYNLDVVFGSRLKNPNNIVKNLRKCKTLVWNGPFGAFEIPPFDNGTNSIAQQTARLTKKGKLLSIAGGGDTIAALAQAGVIDDFSYVSTAGGAFLEWIEGKRLPGVEVLRR